MKSLFFILNLLVLLQFSTAQECEWIKTQNNGSNGEVMTTCVATDQNNNVVVGGRYLTNNLQIDSNNLLTNPDNAFLAKYDSKGNLLWTVSNSLSITRPNYNSFTNIAIGKEGEIFALGLFASDSVFFSDSIFIINNTGWNFNLFIVKYDSAGVAIWARGIYSEFFSNYHIDNWLYPYGIGKSYLYKPSLILDKDNNPIILAVGYRDIAFSDTSLIISGGSGACLIKYSNNGDFLWATNYSNSFLFPTFFPMSDGSIALSTFLRNEIIIGSDTIKSNIPNYWFQALLKIDSTGNIVKGVHISTVINPFNIDINGSNIVKVNRNIVCINSLPFSLQVDSFNVINSSNKLLYYFAYYDEDLNFIHVKQVDSSSTANIEIFEATSTGDYLYFAGFMEQGTMGIGGFTLTNTSSNNNLFIVKMDTLGNVLWAFSNNKSAANAFDIATDTRGDVYVVGNYDDSIHVFDKSEIGSKADGYLAKITDYSIIRGDVFAGPYCAGDTIYIPYTKEGFYDPDSNVFIAELSDEFGNFGGRQFELGQLKTNDSGTIAGTLPLFEVASSGNYRIRVRSTHPQVQSFYQKDSLRLLIYSRDKADPGPTETICRGDTFQLNTYGGTAWQWSPAYKMDDSTLRQPKIILDTTFTYRIVISDSSGCGAPDTAFKTIEVRSNPKVALPLTDFEVCHNAPAELIALFSEGDSLGYRWTWNFVQGANNHQTIRRDSFSLSDTFPFFLPQNVTTARVISVILDDGCSIIKDTALLTVRLNRNPMKGTISTSDSIFCYQSEQNLIGNFTGGDSASYTWEWFEIDNNDSFSLLKSDSLKTSDSLLVQFHPQNTQWQRYALVSKDECTPFVDTTYFTFDIVQNQPRATVFPQDSSICQGSPIILQAALDSGSDFGYHWQWQDEDGIVLQSDTGFNVNSLEVTPDFTNQSS